MNAGGKTQIERMPLRLGWFTSGGGEGSRGLFTHVLQAIESAKLNARLEFLFCNRERRQRAATDELLDIAESRAIPVVTLSSFKFRKRHEQLSLEERRTAFDAAVIERLGEFEPDVSVAAGYMLIAPRLCEVFPMLNLHPARPGGPIGTWQQVIWELIRQGAAESGVWVNEVTPDLDAGPIVSYCRYTVRGGAFDPLWKSIENRPMEELRESAGESLPLFQAIRRAGVQRERPLLTETLIRIADGDLEIFSGRDRAAVDLTDHVERTLESLR